jgi:hypothetical protein
LRTTASAPRPGGAVSADGSAALMIEGSTFASPGAKRLACPRAVLPPWRQLGDRPFGGLRSPSRGINPPLLAGNAVSGGPTSFELAG